MQFQVGQATVEDGQWDGSPPELVELLRGIPGSPPADYPDRDLWWAERAAQLFGGYLVRRSGQPPRARRGEEQ